MNKFSNDFTFFKEAGAINSEANYKLAKSLFERLQKGEAISSVFSNIEEQRKKFVSPSLPWYGAKGINSIELNSIIETAMKFTTKLKVDLKGSEKNPPTLGT